MMLTIGDKVRAAYKTGEYIGEVVELTNSAKAAVKVLAVLVHPEQGDLHNRMDPNVGFFHQRRALANGEIALMPLTTVSAYHGDVPAYADSLIAALHKEKERLISLEQWARKGLQELDELEKEYKL
jgi:kinase-associated protein B